MGATNDDAAGEEETSTTMPSKSAEIVLRPEGSVPGATGAAACDEDVAWDDDERVIGKAPSVSGGTGDGERVAAGVGLRVETDFQPLLW